jgi:hypothetical protein
MDFRVIHPVPLTVADVMAEFHVLDALGRSQGGGSDGPAEPASAAANRQPRGDLEGSVKSDGTLDVCPIIGTTRRLDIATDCFQRGPELLEVLIF